MLRICVLIVLLQNINAVQSFSSISPRTSFTSPLKKKRSRSNADRDSFVSNERESFISRDAFASSSNDFDGIGARVHTDCQYFQI